MWRGVPKAIAVILGVGLAGCGSSGPGAEAQSALDKELKSWRSGSEPANGVVPTEYMFVETGKPARLMSYEIISVRQDTPFEAAGFEKYLANANLKMESGRTGTFEKQVNYKLWKAEKDGSWLYFSNE